MTRNTNLTNGTSGSIWNANNTFTFEELEDLCSMGEKAYNKKCKKEARYIQRQMKKETRKIIREIKKESRLARKNAITI